MLKVKINPTYTHARGFMREVSWFHGDLFCWKVTCDAHNVRQVLAQLVSEYGSITVVREPQGSQWKV